MLLLAREPSEQELLEVMRSGASGYLLETTQMERVPVLVTAVLTGEVCAPRALLDGYSTRFGVEAAAGSTSRMSRLT